MGIKGDECEEILRARGREVACSPREELEAVLPPRKEWEVKSDTVTYRRVQGGEGNKSSQQRIIIDSEGNVYINMQY